MAKRRSNFFESTSIHGLKYIARKDLHWIERICWVAMVAVAYWAMALAVSGSYSNYKNHTMSFVVDTSYLDWQTDFPAISVCEKESTGKIYDVAERLYGKDRNLNFDLFLKDIAFFDGTCHSCEAHCKKESNGCSNDFVKVVNEIRSTCPNLIGSCKWNGVTFDCCKHFRPMFTELGPCYVFNSGIDAVSLRVNEEWVHSSKTKHSRRRKFYSNRETGPGTLVFTPKESIKLYLHSQFDVPFVNHPLSERAVVDFGDSLILTFQVKEVENMEGVEDLSIYQRRCRFPWEPPDGSVSLRDRYSYSSCVANCHATAQLRMCNCTDHFIPFSPVWNSTCNIDGLICLTKFQSTLRNLKTDWILKSGLACDCDSGCLEAEYSIVQKKSFTQSQPVVTIRMNSLPTERFQRIKMRNKVDIMVSLGGTAGLFLGASILSAIEIVCYAAFSFVHLCQKSRNI